ncbi:MAG TPA: amino acid adenylation domain-containing protein [Longimicrobium sp.]
MSDAQGGPRRRGMSVAPLSSGQQRLWFLDRFEAVPGLYSVPGVLRMGPTDPAVLERALNELVRRHESLRTTFAVVNGRPVQVVAPAGRLPLPVDDLAAVPPAEREAAVARAAAAEVARPFDLARGPLFRARLLRLSPAEHVLLLCMHHIVSDGWSLNVVFRELRELYPAFALGLPSPLPEPELQYADFAEWQREHLAAGALRGQLEWWMEALRDAPAFLELPADRPRPAVQGFRGAVHPLAIDPGVAEGVRSLAREEGATPFMVLLAAFQALLHRYSGQDDLVVGSPIAGRTRRQTEGTVGFFVNTLALRARFGGDPSFRALLRQVKETTLGAYAHQDLPFERLVEEMAPERSLARNPLVQVMFTFQNTPGVSGASVLSDPDPEDAARTGATTAKFDLMLFLGETREGLGGGLEYRTDLFDPATAARMAGHLCVLLAGAVAHPDRRVSALPLLRAEERAALLAASRAAPARTEACVHRGFAAQAARTPGAVAVAAADGTLTYARLAARAGALARRLRALGVGPDVPVAVCLERSALGVTALLAVLEAGGACVPLDPAYPAERLAFMRADAGARLVLTRAALRASVAAPGVRVIALDEAPAEDEGWAEVAGGAEPGPESLAYVVYTSGSTGRPKGVALPHRTLAALVAWQLEGAGAPARTLQLAPVSFDVSLQETFVALCSGSTLVVAPEEARRDPRVLLRLLDQAAVERLFLPPSILHLLAAAPAGAPVPGALREVVSAGDALRVTDAVAAFFGRLPGAVLRNQYGPSETHVVTEQVLDGVPAGWPALVPLGRPVAGAAAYVLDGAGSPVPAGVAGELYLGGPGVARGYHGRPALTAERFVPDPFGAPGGRLYRTGDRARRRADGVLEFLGRVDRQVKVRGFRVEPGEAEAALLRHPAVRDAAVDVRSDASGEHALVAWVLPAPGTPAPAAAELRGFLARSLPEHMVPSVFVPVDALPLTPSGKVDRRALPDPSAARAPSSAPFVAPRTQVEAAVADAWREVLGVERVGVNDGFFDLGGHSLLAVQVLSRVQERTGVEVPIREFFEAPTVAALTVAIVRGEAARVDGALTAALLDELRALSEEEVEALLAAP